MGQDPGLQSPPPLPTLLPAKVLPHATTAGVQRALLSLGCCCPSAYCGWGCDSVTQLPLEHHAEVPLAELKSCFKIRILDYNS